LARVVQELTGARLFASLPVFSFASALAAGAGFAVGMVAGQNFSGAVLAGITAAAVAVGVCVVMCRPVVLDLLSVGRRSVSTALAEGQ
jgi:hypothetical protein